MKQEIKLGDKVEVLHGAYKGKTGTVVGMMVLGKDYADPYYEVNMDCEVEERYKCRKTRVTPNNIIGGVLVSDIEVIKPYGEIGVDLCDVIDPGVELPQDNSIAEEYRAYRELRDAIYQAELDVIKKFQEEQRGPYAPRFKKKGE